MQIVLYKDWANQMLAIEVDGKSVFYGNYWDFEAPNDLHSLLLKISESCLDVKVTMLSASLDGESDDE